MRTIVLVFFCLTFLNVACAETTILATVDRTELSTDQALTYKVTVTSTEKQSPLLKPPDFTDFFVLSPAQSNSVAVSQGQLKRTLVFAVALVPKKAGTFTIEPATLTVDKTVYKSQGFAIKATQGEKTPSSLPAVRPPVKRIPFSSAPQTVL